MNRLATIYQCVPVIVTGYKGSRNYKDFLSFKRNRSELKSNNFIDKILFLNSCKWYVGIPIYAQWVFKFELISIKILILCRYLRLSLWTFKDYLFIVLLKFSSCYISIKWALFIRPKSSNSFSNFHIMISYHFIWSVLIINLLPTISLFTPYFVCFRRKCSQKMCSISRVS